MDVTNPGVVNVAAETYGNPDPNGGTAKWTPRELDVLTGAADEGYPLPPNGGADASVFPTPDQVFVDQLLASPPVGYIPTPYAPNVFVDDQSIGQGSMQPVDPGNPSAGYNFVGPADFIVVGPAESFQTNVSEQDFVTVTLTAVLDADHLPTPAGPTTTRYYLVTASPSLTSYPVSVLGRQVTFDGNVTAGDEGAARIIQNYGANFIVVNRDDPSVSNGDVPTMTTPQVGDTFQLDVNRQGSEQVNTSGETINVVIFPSPPINVPFPSQSASSQGTVDVSTGPQPGSPYIGSGVRIPNNERNVSVPDECAVVGLPTNVYV
jgi:hypothetical protein